MRVERVERFLSFPLTSGRKEKKKIGILPKVQLGPQYPRVVFFNDPRIGFCLATRRRPLIRNESISLITVIKLNRRSIETWKKKEKKSQIDAAESATFRGPLQERRWAGSRVICLGSSARKRGRRNGAEGRKEEGGEGVARDGEKRRQLQHPIRIVAGRGGGLRARQGHSGEIIIICIGRFVRLRERSAALGRVARVPLPPPLAPGPSRPFHGPRPAYALLCQGVSDITGSAPNPVLVKLGHCGPRLHFIYIYICSMSSLSLSLEIPPVFSDIQSKWKGKISK